MGDVGIFSICVCGLQHLFYCYFDLLELVDVELKASYTCTVYMETWTEICPRKPVLHVGSTVHVYWKLNYVYITRVQHDRNDQVVHNLAIWIVWKPAGLNWNLFKSGA